MPDPHSLHEQPLATASCASPLHTLVLQRCFLSSALCSFELLCVVWQVSESLARDLFRAAHAGAGQGAALRAASVQKLPVLWCLI